MSFPWLPVELYSRIFQLLPQDDECVVVLARCTQVNSSVRIAASNPGLWKPFYEKRYTIHEETNETKRSIQHGDNWYLRYSERRRIDMQAIGCINNLDSSTDFDVQLKTMEGLVKLDSDVWDILKMEAARPMLSPYDFAESGGEYDVGNAGPGPISFTRRFWCKEALGIIARRSAVSRLMKLQYDDVYVPLEEALSCLSSVYDAHPNETLSLYDAVAKECQETLDQSGISYDQSSSDFSLEELFHALCAFMQSKGFRLAQGDDFSRIQNVFPHYFMNGYKDTIPLSLASIFLCITARIGIPTAPINTPGRVLVSMLDRLVDVSSDMIMPKGRGLGDLSLTLKAFASRLMLKRTAANLVSFLGAGLPRSIRDSGGAGYAVGLIQLMSTSLEDPHLYYIVGEFGFELTVHPFDIELVIYDLLGSHINSTVLETFVGSELKSKNNFWHKPASIWTSPLPRKFFVGQVVLISGAWGVVIDCVIRRESPTTLDASATGVQEIIYFLRGVGSRPIYEATENLLVPENFTKEELESFYDKCDGRLGFYFAGIEYVEGKGGSKARFLMNETMKRYFPEDDAAGATWMESPSLALE